MYCFWCWRSLSSFLSRKVYIYIALCFLNLYLRSCSVSDNEDLAHRANVLLVRMCGVTPPRSLISPLLNAIFTAIQKSPVCLHVVFFRPLCSQFFNSPGKSAWKRYQSYRVRTFYWNTSGLCSWPPTAVLYFRQLLLISEARVLDILDVCAYLCFKVTYLIED